MEVGGILELGLRYSLVLRESVSRPKWTVLM